VAAGVSSMMCSVNEITSLLYKAAVGSGRTVGLAQDIARAGAWLCSCGQEGVAVTLDYLHSVPRDPSWPAVLGLVAAGVESQATITDVGDGLMLEAMATVLGFDAEVGYEIRNIDGVATISCRPAVGVEQPRFGGAVTVSDLDVAAATDLAARTYVPASDVSRLKGAGASINDND
jgi:hypothetical protein